MKRKKLMVFYRQFVKLVTPNNINNIEANEKKKQNEYDKLTRSVLPFCCDFFWCYICFLFC